MCLVCWRKAFDGYSGEIGARVQELHGLSGRPCLMEFMTVTRGSHVIKPIVFGSPLSILSHAEAWRCRYRGVGFTCVVVPPLFTSVELCQRRCDYVPVRRRNKVPRASTVACPGTPWGVGRIASLWIT